MEFFKNIKKRIDDLSILFALFLSPFLFIGERDRLNRIERAARELPSNPTQDQIVEAAARQGVSDADQTLVESRVGQLQEPSRDIVGAGRAAVIEAAFQLEQEAQLGQPPREITTETGAVVALSNGQITARFERPEVLSEEDVKESLEEIGFEKATKEKEIASRRRRKRLREKLAERAEETGEPTLKERAKEVGAAILPSALGGLRTLFRETFETPEGEPRLIGKVKGAEEKGEVLLPGVAETISKFATGGVDVLVGTGRLIKEGLEFAETQEGKELAAKPAQILESFFVKSFEKPEGEGIRFIGKVKGAEDKGDVLFPDVAETAAAISKTVEVAAPIIAGVGLGLTTQILKQIREEPAQIAGEVFVVGKVIKGTTTLAERILTRISPSFRGVETGPLGVQVIKGIPAEGKAFELGLIPKGKGIQPSLLGLAEEATIPLRPTPKLPALTDVQRKIINVAIERGDAITGSLAQKTLVKGSRTFEDVDIVSRFPQATANAIKKALGDSVIVKKVEITNSPLGNFNIYRIIDKKTGRQIADIDPVKFAEEGFVKQFPTVKVGEVTFVSPEARLAAKVAQLRRGKVKSGKVTLDIEQLTGGEFTAEQLKSPLIRGAFGFTRQEQAALIGEKGIVTTSARDLFTTITPRVEVAPGPSGLGLFATPPEPGTGRALTRVTRLALEEREATLADILSGNVALTRQKPQIVFFEGQTIGDKFKPFGIKGSSELEVVLPAGNIIQKVKTRAVTIIEGKRVPIIQARIIEEGSPAANKLKKLSEVTKENIAKAQRGTLSKSEVDQLTRSIKTRTGLDLEFGSARVVSKPVVPVSRLAGSAAVLIGTAPVSAAPSIEPTPTRFISQAPSVEPSMIVSAPPSVPPSMPPSIPPSVPPSIPPSIPPSVPPSIPPSIPPSVPPTLEGPTGAILTEAQRRARQTAFDVLVRKGEKRGDKFVKVASGLPRNKAIALGAELTDTFIEASFRVRKTNKLTKIRDLLNAPNLSKFRGPVPGSKLPGDTIIEKARHRIDTIGEKRQLSLFKELAKQKKKSISKILLKAKTQQLNFIVAKKQNTNKKKQQQMINFVKTKKQQQTNFLIAKKKKKIGFL